ncbi:MAG: hypothetical protein RI842_10470 [Schleiferiaceae bacterium]|nr:hypothetical protein [Schleiferiaceae bacterium]
MEPIKFMNRGAITVQPKKPFFEWGNAVFADEHPLKLEDDPESSTYLVDDDWVSEKEALQAHWAAIFEQELFSMCTDENTWPPNRNLNMFMAWFSFRFASMVIDLEEGGLWYE